MKPIAVALDFDGVIIRSYDVFFEALSQAFSAYDLHLTHEAFLDIFTSGMWDGVRRHGIKPSWDADFERQLSEGLSARYYGCELVPGMTDTLRQLLASDCLVCIITASFAELAHDVLATKNVTFPRYAIFGRESGRSKVPKIRSLRDSATTVFYVGDTAGDVADGKAAGAITIGVSWGWHPPHLLRDAVYLLNTPSELIETVRSEVRPSSRPLDR